MAKKEDNIDNYSYQGPSTLFKKEFLKAGTRITITSVAVAVALEPLYLWQTRLQTGVAKSGCLFRSPFLFNYKNIQPFIKGCWDASKASLAKNSVLANREPISHEVDELVGSKESKENKYASTLLTAGTLASLDTLTGQYYANKRTLHALKIDIKLTLRQKFSFAKIGLLSRGFKNFAVTLAYVNTASSTIRFPVLADKTPLLNSLLSNVFFAYLVCPFIAAETIYKRKIASINLQTLQTPSYAHVVKTAWQEGGIKTFFRGSLINGLYTTVAFLTINSVNYLLDNYLFNANWQKNSRATFFPPPKSPQPADIKISSDQCAPTP